MKCFHWCRDSPVIPRAQLKARGIGFPFHKPLVVPMSPPGVIWVVLVLEHYDYHPHKGNGVRSFQGSVEQDILEPGPLRGGASVWQSCWGTSNRRLGLGCCQLDGKCLEPLCSNWSEHTQL